MLTEYKNIYKKKALDYPEGKKLEKSELCFRYCDLVDNNSPYADACLSEIIYRFFNLPMNAYYSQEKIIATEEDCYNWLITSITYCLKTRAWNDQSSTIYNDPNGPEKSINTCFRDERMNFFVAAKREKRSLNYNSLSLDILQEDASDAYYMPVYDDDVIVNSVFYDTIRKYYLKKDYLPAFTIDAIADYDFFDRTEEEGKIVRQFNKKKLKKHLRNIDDRYCKIFAKKYNLDYSDVLDSSKYITSLTYDRMDRRVNNLFKLLSRDQNLIEELSC